MLRRWLQTLMRVGCSLGLIAFVMSPAVVFADDAPAPAAPATTAPSFSSILKGAVENVGNKSKVYDTKGGENALQTAFTNILNAVLGLLGAAATILVIYAGYLWMTSNGDEGQVEKAKTIIKQVVIGFIVFSLAYAIVSYVFYIITVAVPRPA